MSLFFSVPIIPTKKAAQASIAPKLAVFAGHKQSLLSKLQNGCKSGFQSQPFDPNKSWRDLSQLAELYFKFEIMKPNALTSAQRSKRLRDLARALRVARGLTDRAMKDDVGECLYVAFCTQKGITPQLVYPIEKDGSSVLTRCADEITEMATTLAKLQATTLSALQSIKPDKAGRPTLLPRDCIQGLARVYRNSTGKKPGIGAGPFVDFVHEFMNAMGRTDFKYESVIEAIKDAHRRFKPSWFDAKYPSY